MSLDEYNEQRIKGAEEIISTVKKFASERGITGLECVWDNGYEMVERDNHILEISSQGKRSKEVFSDQQLADYPGRAGTAKTEHTLHEMVSNLI